jgi:hypothetical protein
MVMESAKDNVPMVCGITAPGRNPCKYELAITPTHIRMAAQTPAYVASKGGDGVDARVRELSLISLIACFCLGLAWAHEADFFAIAFAVATAIAVAEAVRRSL